MTTDTSVLALIFDASIPDLRKVFDLNLMGTLLPTYVLADLFPEMEKVA